MKPVSQAAAIALCILLFLTVGIRQAGCQTPENTATSTPPNVALPQPNAMCFVRDQDIPDLKMPPIGKHYVYAPIHASGLAEAKKICNDAVFELLMKSYTGHAKSLQWEVQLYDEQGKPTERDCAASGCDHHTLQNTMCIVHSPKTHFPDINAPTGGDGYEMELRSSTGINDADTKCTGALFRELTKRYSQSLYYSDYNHGGLSVQWDMVYFDTLGNHVSACSSAGCDHRIPNGSCIVFDLAVRTTPPDPTSDPLGNGYAVLGIYATSYAEVRNRCTKDEFIRLTEEYTRNAPHQSLMWLIDFRGLEGHGPPMKAPYDQCAASAIVPGCESNLPPRAFCILFDGTAEIPVSRAPLTGKGYAMKRVQSANWEQAKNACTHADFEELKNLYTQSGGTRVVTFNAEFCDRDSACSSGCPIAGCYPDRAPQGVCLVRNDLTNEPEPGQAATGQGYAMKKVAAASFEQARSACTHDDFEELMALYKKEGGTRSVTWEVQFCNRITCTSGCARSGCEVHSVKH